MDDNRTKVLEKGFHLSDDTKAAFYKVTDVIRNLKRRPRAALQAVH